MTYAELSEAQARRSRQFAEAQTDAMTVYCDAERDLKELQAENAKLLDENARLRSCLSDDADNARQIMGENAKLREQGERLFDKTLELGTDNAKLREFARDMWCMTTFCRGTSDAEIADMYRRMRELGFMENYGEEVSE